MKDGERSQGQEEDESGEDEQDPDDGFDFYF
jgi:hypothetical protein